MAPYRKKVFSPEVAILIAPTVVFEEEKYMYTEVGHWVIGGIGQGYVLFS
jgi:hypothetical protein